MKRLRVMRKSNIILAAMAIAAVLFSGCAREIEGNEIQIDKSSDVIGFLMPSSNTRAEVANETVTGVVIPFGDDGEGNAFVLEESIQVLGPLSRDLATRGTPAYTENVDKLYGAFNAVVLDGSKNEKFKDGAFTYADDAWTRRFYQDPWQDVGTDPLYFFMRMPAQITGAVTPEGGTTPYTYNLSGTTQSITFTYESPASAADQQDILFAARPLTKAEYETALSNNTYPDVLFNHALTGVKFAIGNTAADITANSIAITEIIFHGLKVKGTCTITPAKENNYQDEITNYTSATAASWTLDANTTKDISSGTYSSTVDFATGAGSFGEKGDYPTSFSAAGNTQNLNKEDGSQTFWLIPQTMSEAVTLTIKYTFGGVEREGILDFGEFLTGLEFKAGEIRTYTIRVDEVNVKIEDDVEIKGSATDGFKESVKSAVTITNTGNTKSFIRAAIVGQWLDGNDNPVFGFTDNLSNLYLVESWYEDQFVKTTPGTHGTFTGLAGYKTADNPYRNWVLCKDGYYYYQLAVDPGDATGSPLFDTYTVGTRPDATLAGVPVERDKMYFTLEIATQAISAKTRDGGDYTWDTAWENALGAKPEKK